MIIDKVIEQMISEDIETVTKFLGYEPDEEVFNNTQLLEEELENAARQMTEETLTEFYEESQNKLKMETKKKYCLKLAQNLLAEMKKCQDMLNELNNILAEIPNI